MFRNSVLLFTIWTAPAVAQELPPGKARAIVIGKCGECHALDVVTAAQGNKARWQVVVEAMVTNGVKLSKSEIRQVVDYLAKSFPERPEQGK